ncbi:MAG: methyltransferase domain-containing protein [Parcubacteria group bacterium]
MDYIKNTINFYDQNVDEYIKNTTNLQNKDWLDKFISYLPKNGSVLDIGCAFGRDTDFFASNKYVTTGIDLSQKMIDKARSSVPDAKFHVMNMLDLNFKNKSFDGVWCSATLLHLNKVDALKALKEMKRVLKASGVLYINLKKGSGEKVITDDRYDNAKKFYSYYCEKEIKDMLSEHKFEILDFVLEENPIQEYVNTGIIFLIAKNK